MTETTETAKTEANTIAFEITKDLGTLDLTGKVFTIKPDGDATAYTDNGVQTAAVAAAPAAAKGYEIAVTADLTKSALT